MMPAWPGEIARAWRASLRRPGFLLLATGVLALGIASSTAVFALINATLLQPLPIPHADRLLVLGRSNDGQVGRISKRQFLQLRDLQSARVLGLQQSGTVVNIVSGGVPRQVPSIRIDRHILPALGLQPMLGRNFDAAEDRSHGPAAVLISHGFWRRDFAADRQVVGRTIEVGGTTRRIIGVLPAAFTAIEGEGDVILPMGLAPSSRQDGSNYVALARLQPGGSAQALSAEVDTRLRAMYRAQGQPDWQAAHFGAQPYAAWKHRGIRPTLLLFLAAALLLLLIAVVNLSNLMMLRALSRSHDVAVRHALGAPILRRLLPTVAEGLLVGMIGALAGLLLAAGALTILRGMVPATWLAGGQLHLGAGAWAIALGMGCLSALLAALLGGWRSRVVTTVGALREGGRSGLDAHGGLVGRALVVAQLALATVLLCAAGVISHALYDASQVHMSYAGDHIITFELTPSEADYADVAAIRDLVARLHTRLLGMPGVSGAAVTTNLPTSNGMAGQLNDQIRLPGGARLQVQYHGVSPGFFGVFSIGLRRGRLFVDGDRHGSEHVAVISRKLASRFAGGDAVGKQIHVMTPSGGSDVVRVVGVVDDTRQNGPLWPGDMVLYVPLAQMPDAMLVLFRQFEPFRVALRADGGPAVWRATLRQTVAEIAPGQPIARLRSMREVVHSTTAQARLNLMLIGTFAVLALLLAGAGAYAVMAVLVASREREFGVRAAMGASPRQLWFKVLSDGLRQVALGLLVGVGLGSVGVRAVRGLMAQLGRSVMDPWAIGAACAVLVAAGLLACVMPAVRAGRVQPMHALRGE